MIVVWILIALVGLCLLFFLLHFPYLLIKRQSLVRKMKKNADEVIVCRNRFRSVFKKDGNPDLIVQKGKNRYSVFVVSTPFKRIRYHFDNNERLDLFWERKGVMYLKQAHPRPSSAVSFDHSFRIKKYVFSFHSEPETIPFVIPHPAPMLLTRVSGPKYDVLFNGDELFDGIRICGLQYFLSNILSEETDE